MKTLLFALTLFILASCSTEPQIEQYIVEDEELESFIVKDTVPEFIENDVKMVIRIRTEHEWVKGTFLVTKIDEPDSFGSIYIRKIIYNEPDCEVAKTEKAKAQIALDEWKATKQHIKDLEKSLESYN